MYLVLGLLFSPRQARVGIIYERTPTPSLLYYTAVTMLCVCLARLADSH